MTGRKTIFVEAYTHDIIDLDEPAKSVITQVVVSDWDKLILPGPAEPDRRHAAAPSEPALFDLKADPLETKNLASAQPGKVGRLKALQHAFWKID